MASDSLEFLVARAIDPYSTENNQSALLKNVSTRIANNSNDRSMVVKLLTHKMLSPDQNEASRSLDALEFLSTNGNPSIFEEFNKLVTLNAFIQLLSPEHHGHQTTAQNKDKAVSLLSKWKNATANVENVSKVYSMLCSRKLIGSKMSDNKTKFETVQQNVTPNHSASSEIEMVRLKAQMLNDLFDTVDSGHKLKDEKLLHEIYSQLINVRPTLFHFTVEASDKQEQEMVEILALNDRLNSIINRHNNFGKPPHPDREISVRFDPESTKMDRISHVHRKPTPHSKAVNLLNDTDYSKLLNAGASKSPDRKRLSDSSINEEMENLEISDPH